MTLAEKRGAPWTPKDVKRMRALARMKLSARQAAGKLNRTVGAVKFAAMIRGVRFHAIEQPEGTQRTDEQRALLSRLTTARHRRRRAKR